MITLLFISTAKSTTTKQKESSSAKINKKSTLYTTKKSKVFSTTQIYSPVKTLKISSQKLTSPTTRTKFTKLTKKNAVNVPNFEKSDVSSPGKIVGLVFGMISLIVITVIIYKWKVNRENNTFQPLNQVCVFFYLYNFR